ncbi:MAG: transporter-related protein [Chlorobi bacterium]|nr:transporter-related protein [Chlorobiota bacterium]
MILIEKLTKIFGRGTPNEVRALREVSLGIDAGEFVVVIGTNGSGKSTLLNAIAGGFPPDSGRISLNGRDVTRMTDHQRARHIGRVFQNPFSGTAPTMTIAENLRLASLRGIPKRLSIGLDNGEMARLKERSAELGMGLETRLETPIGLLSGGERQALTLLMATLRRPDILLLDEHTAALDPRSAEQVMRLTERIVREHHLTTLMVTHDMEEAVHHGSRLLMMHEGTVALDLRAEAKAGLTPAILLGKFAELRIMAR